MAIPPDAIEQDFIHYAVSASGTTASWHNLDTLQVVWMLTHIDCTCTVTSPSQWYCEATIRSVGYPFFHDSQSIGEGLGISFYWRGALVIPSNDYLDVKLTQISSAGSTPLAIYAGGYARQRPNPYNGI
jgi:hypothetical protein